MFEESELESLLGQQIYTSLQSVQTASGAHPHSYSIRTNGYFSWGVGWRGGWEATGAWDWQLLHLVTKFRTSGDMALWRAEVQHYLYSPFWPVASPSRIQHRWMTELLGWSDKVSGLHQGRAWFKPWPQYRLYWRRFLIVCACVCVRACM
jgi:hypothetical protein